MRRTLAAFAADRRGVTAMLTALCGVALIGSAALGVDLGDIYMKTRQLQGVADLAAMASVQSLDPAASQSPAATAQATAALNPWRGGITAQAVTGLYAADGSVAAARRFTPSTASPNAVQVTLQAPVPLYFAGLLIGRSSLTLTRSAVAARAQFAAFSIGSGLASLNGGVANALLSALTGSQVQLSVMNYQALASANVDLLRYIPALQTRAGLQALSFSQVLTTSVTPAAALGALADSLSASGQPAAASAAQSLAAASASLPGTPLSTILDLGPYESQDQTTDGSGASLSVGALGLADALLAAANGSRQISLALNGLVPGVPQVNLWLAIGQRPSQSPWLTVTDAGQVVVRTAQMRLYIQASLAPGVLSTASGGALVTLPIYVEAASAQAKLQDMQCPESAASQGLDLSVSPSLGTFALAQLDTTTLANFSTPVALQPATLLNAVLVRATAYSRVDIGGGQASWQGVSFSQADIAAGTMKSVFTSDVARASVASLLAGTSVQVQTPVVTLGLTPAVLSPELQALLVQAAPSLDTLVGQVEAMSGVRVGEADVWADGLRCHGAALVS